MSWVWETLLKAIKLLFDAYVPHGQNSQYMPQPSQNAPSVKDSFCQTAKGAQLRPCTTPGLRKTECKDHVCPAETCHEIAPCAKNGAGDVWLMNPPTSTASLLFPGTSLGQSQPFLEVQRGCFVFALLLGCRCKCCGTLGSGGVLHTAAFRVTRGAGGALCSQLSCRAGFSKLLNAAYIFLCCNQRENCGHLVNFTEAQLSKKGE